MKGKRGWFKHPIEHGLAAKGVKTTNPQVARKYLPHTKAEHVPGWKSLGGPIPIFPSAILGWIKSVKRSYEVWDDFVVVIRETDTYDFGVEPPKKTLAYDITVGKNQAYTTLPVDFPKLSQAVRVAKAIMAGGKW